MAVEFFWGSPPSGWSPAAPARSGSFLPAELGFRAIFGAPCTSYGRCSTNDRSAASHTHTPPHPASAIVKMTYTFFSTTAKRCRHYVYIRENPRHPAAQTGTATTGEMWWVIMTMWCLVPAAMTSHVEEVQTVQLHHEMKNMCDAASCLNPALTALILHKYSTCRHLILYVSPLLL